MIKRERELLLELLLIRSRYSQQEIRAVDHAIRSHPQSDELAELLSLIIALDEQHSKQRISKGSKPTPRSLKARFVARLRDAKKTPRKTLVPIARSLGVEMGDNRDDIVRLVEQRIERLDPEEFERFVDDLSQVEADKSYLDLAHFLIDRKRD